MIALQSVVLPMPLRPMIATGSSPISKRDVLQDVRAAVEGVEVLDRERAAPSAHRALDAASSRPR